MAASPRRKVRAGDRVTRSQGLITIPEVERMVVESGVDEASVHKARPGQTAAIMLDAYPNVRLAGKVSRVGTLARSSIERPFEEKRFDLIIDIDPQKLVDLRPEMTARVDVMVGERRNVLMVPVNAIFERDGMLITHVVRLWGVETRQVELGESNDIATEVTAGLKEGERVALTDVIGGKARAIGPAGAAVPSGGGAMMKDRDGSTINIERR
jgi:multidrug efflux pump subunit AcrA (membrane-fusion protein)